MLLMQGTFAKSLPGEAEATLVIYNIADPGSRELAEFYSKVRDIPAENLIGLKTPLSEEITRGEYDASIAVPLRKELLSRGIWMATRDLLNRTIVYASKVRYAAVIRGMPLKIRQETSPYSGDAVVQEAPYGSVNAASVDSELAVLGLFSPQISGILRNPFTGEGEAMPPPWLLMVSRLDGPSLPVVKDLIASTLRAEEQGLKGWAYTDLRATSERGYARGEEWIRRVGELLGKNGVPVITDTLPETIPSGFPVNDAASYYGWYTENLDGPFAMPGFRFVQGAVAVHLHSFSASSLRSDSVGWTAPLIARGACASLGNVYEPYLPFTANLGEICSSLLSGKTLAESHCRSLAALSWMNVCVGDPLYRPYAWFSKQEETSADIWSRYRLVILGHGGEILQAGGDLERLATESKEGMPLESLGNAQLLAGKHAQAAATFRKAMSLEKDPTLLFRLQLEEARAWELSGKRDQSLTLLKAILPEESSPERRTLIRNWIARIEKETKETSP
jgi:uncharacterized protein (TIGR03790 family)